jgi:hypothetical protein
MRGVHTQTTAKPGVNTKVEYTVICIASRSYLPGRASTRRLARVFRFCGSATLGKWGKEGTWLVVARCRYSPFIRASCHQSQGRTQLQQRELSGVLLALTFSSLLFFLT